MKKTERQNVVIVMPAYNAARTVKETYFEIPSYLRKNIILVDDKSTDNTVEVAQELGIQTFTHPQNLGYGGNQKTCYWEALKYKPSVVVMLHPDYQYDAKQIPNLIDPILEGRSDFMFGSRMQNEKDALAGGMPALKFYLNKIITRIENVLLGVTFSEHFSGLRAYSPEVLQTIPFQKFSNDFVFDQQAVASALSYGFRIDEIAIPTRYHEKASSIHFIKGSQFLIETFVTLIQYKLHTFGLIKNALFSDEAFNSSFSSLRNTLAKI